jgi:predicted RNA binding protein YcfA (HicA-like mRNA interferase family)
MTGPLYRELTQRLRDAGCRFVREGKGSHEIWYSPITRRHFPVPSNIVIRITANAILKQVGLPKAF